MSERLTARDVEGQKFKSKLRGYDPDDVLLFLKSVAEEIERLNLENGRLREKVGSLEQRVKDFQTREKTLQQTLVTAQRMADELKQKTVSESELLVKDARIKAERLLQQAQEQLAQIESEISRTRLERDLFENRLRNVIEEHLALIDLRKSERAEHQGDEKVTYLRRRAASDA